MQINLAEFMAVASVAYMFGSCAISGFALSLIYQLYKPDIDSKPRWRLPIYTFAVCGTMTAGGLGAMFSFVALVIRTNPDDDGTVARAVVFGIFLIIGVAASITMAHLFNLAARKGRVVLIDLATGKRDRTHEPSE